MPFPVFLSLFILIEFCSSRFILDLLSSSPVSRLVMCLFYIICYYRQSLPSLVSDQQDHWSMEDSHAARISSKRIYQCTDHWRLSVGKIEDDLVTVLMALITTKMSVNIDTTSIVEMYIKCLGKVSASESDSQRISFDYQTTRSAYCTHSYKLISDFRI